MSLRPVKSLDKSALVNLYNIGEKEFLLRMIDSFLLNTPTRVKTARGHLERKDWKSVHLIAHSLRASAANIGTVAVREMAEQLEEMASLGMEDDLLHGLERLEVVLVDAIRSLKQERDQWEL